MATRSPITRLKSVLLPTLGRPTKATTGRPSVGVVSEVRPDVERRARRGATVLGGARDGSARRAALRATLVVERGAAVRRLGDGGQRSVSKSLRLGAPFIGSAQLVDALRNLLEVFDGGRRPAGHADDLRVRERLGRIQ